MQGGRLRNRCIEQDALLDQWTSGSVLEHVAQPKLTVWSVISEGNKCVVLVAGKANK